jgi:predicted nucleotidyltransferase
MIRKLAVYFHPDLQGLTAKTVGLVDVLRDALDSLAPQLQLAFIHGSVAQSRERSGSDVDLIIVSSLGLADLSPALEAVEQRLGRPVNATVYSPEEFRSKVSAKNHFLCSVLEKAKLFLIGTTDDLARIAGRRPR